MFTANRVNKGKNNNEKSFGKRVKTSKFNNKRS